MSQQQQAEQEKQAEAKAKHIGTNTMGMVLDLLCFCVQHHGYRSVDCANSFTHSLEREWWNMMESVYQVFLCTVHLYH